MPHRFIIIGKAGTISRQLDELRQRELGIVPCVAEIGNRMDSRAAVAADADGFAAEVRS